MVVSAALGLALNSASLVVLAHGAWWTTLSALALRGAKAPSTRAAGTKFFVLIPAHNEEAGLAATLRSLTQSDYLPTPRVVVVADNCIDRTAQVARDCGVEVIERNDSSRRGKGYALDFALQQISDGDKGVPQVVVFVDADSEVNAGFFDALAQHFANSQQPAQAYYQAAPGETRLGQLREVAFRLLHWSRPLGASRLGLPTTVKGNGMAIHWEDAKDGLGALGITEDAEMTLRFAERGLRFEFVPGAVVTGRMAQSFDEARTQDERWEGGRYALQRHAVITALSCLIRGDVRGAAPALEIASLPMSLLVLSSTGTVIATVVLSVGSSILAVVGAGSIAAYLVVGGVAARLGLRDILAFVEVPRFLLHKLGIYLRLAARRGPSEWKRSTR